MATTVPVWNELTIVFPMLRDYETAAGQAGRNYSGFDWWPAHARKALLRVIPSSQCLKHGWDPVEACAVAEFYLLKAYRTAVTVSRRGKGKAKR